MSRNRKNNNKNQNNNPNGQQFGQYDQNQQFNQFDQNQQFGQFDNGFDVNPMHQQNQNFHQMPQQDFYQQQAAFQQTQAFNMPNQNMNAQFGQNVNFDQPQFNQAGFAHQQYDQFGNPVAQPLTYQQMHMMTSPFTYPHNNIVSTYRPELEEQPEPVQDIRANYSHIPMPLNPFPVDSSAYYNEFNKTGYIPVPEAHQNVTPQGNNPFFQQQFRTMQFQAPVANFQQAANQPQSQLAVKMAQLDQLLANNMITQDAYMQRRQVLIEQELNNN